jgi:transcriptional regulator with XRE-family HTH domain
MNWMGRRTPQETGAEDFGRRLRELRQSRGWTLAELAEKVGVQGSMVGNYERGIHYPPIPTLVKLAHALEVSADRLLGIDEGKVDDIQDRRLYALFLEADRADLGKQGLVKQVLESLLRHGPQTDKRRTGTDA